MTELPNFTFAMQLKSTRAYLKILSSAVSWRMSAAIGLLVLVGLTEGVGLLLIIPLLQVVGLDVGYGAIGGLANYIEKGFSFFGIHPSLINVLCVFVFFIFLHETLFYVRTVFLQKVENDFIYTLQTRLYNSVIQSKWNFFASQKISDFSHGLTTAIIRAQMATTNILNALAHGVVVLVYVGLALKMSVGMTVVVSGCGLFLLLTLLPRMKRAGMLGKRTVTEGKRFTEKIISDLHLMKVIKSEALEENSSTRTKDIAKALRDSRVDDAQKQANMERYVKIGSAISLGIILYVAIVVLKIYSTAIVFLLLIFSRVLPKMIFTAVNLYGFFSSLPHVSFVLDLLDKATMQKQFKGEMDKPVEFQKDVSLSHIRFDYEENPKNVFIDDLSLKLKKGQITALVGPSGAGKTTIADLLTGINQAIAGKILVDGNPLNSEQMTEWRKNISYVVQDPYLLNDSIEENLRWSNPAITEEDIWAVLEKISMAEFVLSQPKKLKTHIGDGGALLSGGQRQRLAFARALLRKPKVLILDEATNSLDSVNERKIMKVISELKGKTTTLLLSHKLLTIREADTIYCIENGAVVDSGRWEELISKKNSMMHALLEAQKF